MTLPKKLRAPARPISVTVRLTKQAAEHLRVLAKEHGLSQGEVVEHLLSQEWESYHKKSSKNS